jgi:hypothetical protein
LLGHSTLDRMNPDAKLPTDAQRQKLCEMIHQAFIEIRLLGWDGKAGQAADLADAFHNLPRDMWRDDFSLQFFRDAFLSVYQKKYPTRIVRDYVAMVDEIIAMKD